MNFPDPFESGLNAFAQVKGLGDHFREEKRRRNVEGLAAMYLSGQAENPDEIAAEIVRNGGNPEIVLMGQEQKRAQAEADLKRMAGLLVSAPAAMRPQIYANFRPIAESRGVVGAPATWDESLLPLLQHLAGGNQLEKWASAGQGTIFNTGSGEFRRTPDETGEWGYFPDPNNPANEVYGQRRGNQFYDMNGNRLAGAPSAPGMDFQTPDAPEWGADLNSLPPQEQAAASRLIAGGQDFHIVGGRVVPGLSQPVAPVGGRPRSAPGSELAAETLQVRREELQARNEANALERAARAERDQERRDAKHREALARQAETAETAQLLIDNIDRLTSSDGFNSLGTTAGNIATNVPLIPMDVKDADAQLKVIAGQVALNTIARLKSLSSVGATGFGALTAPELTLLQNSITALKSEDISNQQLKKSLAIIREKMEKIADWQPPAPSAPSAPSAVPRAGFEVLD